MPYKNSLLEGFFLSTNWMLFLSHVEEMTFATLKVRYSPFSPGSRASTRANKIQLLQVLGKSIVSAPLGSETTTLSIYYWHLIYS